MLYATLRVRLLRLFEGVGRKLGLSNSLIGVSMLRLKKSGRLRAPLFPTSTSTTSWPLRRSIASIVIACVRCPRPSPCTMKRILIDCRVMVVVSSYTM